MSKTFTFLAISAVLSIASAQSRENVTINEHYKAVEICKSLKIAPGRCKELADKCHAEKDIPACMREKAKSEK